MLIKVGYDISYEVWSPTPMILMLYIHPSRSSNLREKERLVIEPEISVEDFLDPFGNRCARIVARPGVIRLRGAALVADSGEPDPVGAEAPQHPVEQLPVDTLPYLLASRYCEVDQLGNTAWELFGHTPLGWPRVQAVCDWVHQHVTFGYGFARDDKTAFDTFQEARGVCRDFTHLAMTFCRCLNIPARYITGYLGDIGVPPAPFPMDFSAWFEVYLGGAWRTFDARHNQPRVGRITMARGRDATDVAITTTFGKHALRGFSVQTDEVAADEARAAVVLTRLLS
ncbi:MAG: transglutaminase family protein [Verrucomicrobiota bacterium]|nr:transglutaminase family protein [Verrucomicrobiota bacterium]